MKKVSDTIITIMIEIPPPPDEILKFEKLTLKSGDHLLTPVHESFALITPRRIQEDPEPEIHYFPNKEKATWVIFKYYLEDEIPKESQY